MDIIQMPFSWAKSQAIKAELDRIAKAHKGRLHDVDVVEAARDPENILHGYFEWDQARGHEAYLLVQAGVLIRRIQTQVIRKDEPPRAVRTYVKVPGEAGFQRIETVLASPDKKEKYLDDALRELQSCQTKYQTITELAGVWDAVAVAKDKRSSSRKAG